MMIRLPGNRWTRAVVAAIATMLAGAAWAAADAQAHMERAQKLFDGGDIRAATVELKNALQQDPSLVPARHLLGRAYLSLGDGLSAEKELLRARALAGDSPELGLDLAEAYLLQRHPDEALELLESAPEGPIGVRARALTLRGLAQAESRRFEEARTSLTEALSVDPDAHKAALGLARLDLLAGDTDAAQRTLEQVLEKRPNELSALLLLAEIQRRGGHPEAALALYDRAVQGHEKDVRPLLGRATVYLMLNRLAPAEADLDAVEAANKGLIMTAYLRGLLAYMKGDLGQAHNLLQTVLGRAPQHTPSQLLFGLVSYQRGEYELVEEYLGRFLASQPDNLAAVKTLAAARLKLKQPEGAIALLQPLVSADTKDVQLVTLLGSAYLMNGEHAKGAELLQSAVVLAPDAAQLRTQLAMGLLAEGQTGAAADQLQTAVELGQDVIQADVLLVLTHLRAGEPEEALKASQALEARMPDNPVAYNLTGLSYLALNEQDKARERFNKALSVDPKFMTAETNLARMDVAKRDLEAADRRFGRILELEPNSLAALVGLAGTAELRGDEAGMVSRLEQAAEKNPASTQPSLLLARHYLRSGDPLKALAAAREAETRAPDSAAVLELLGRAQAAVGEASSAERSFERLVEVAPTVENYLLLARIRIATKNLGGARSAAKEALARDPSSLRAKLVSAQVALQDDRPNDALQMALDIQQAHPDQVDGFRLEGLVRTKLGSLTEAASAFQRAYQIHKSAELARYLANTYKNLGREDEAVATLRDWLKDNPDDLPTRMVLGMSLQLAGDKRGAIEQYEAIYAREKDNSIVLNNLAWLYFEVQDPRAVKTAEEAYEADPERAEVADTYGWILLNRGGDAHKALAALQQAYVSLPTNAEVGYHVAVALHRVGRDQEAARTLRNALGGSPRFPDLDQAKALLEELQD
jgi:putative PEP-CTERM system TPR-repeat lipoprotein